MGFVKPYLPDFDRDRAARSPPRQAACRPDNRQLVDAVQARCQFAAGDVRVVVLDAQPLHRQSQHYQLIDAAIGVLEEGYVSVADMLARQPWTPDFPVAPVASAPPERVPEPPAPAPA